MRHTTLRKVPQAMHKLWWDPKNIFHKQDLHVFRLQRTEIAGSDTCVAESKGEFGDVATRVLPHGTYDISKSTSKTLEIYIPPLGKSYEMIFNLALSYRQLFILPANSLISPWFPSKELSMRNVQVLCLLVILQVLPCLPISGQVGWFWQLPILIFEERRAF